MNDVKHEHRMVPEIVAVTQNPDASACIFNLCTDRKHDPLPLCILKTC